MSKIRDTDYLTISARVRAMENRLVTRERMERMVEARSDDEAVKVLAECGYEELPGPDQPWGWTSCSRRRGRPCTGSWAAQYPTNGWWSCFR